MTEQERQQAVISRREAAVKAIIATNAEISGEQFAKLMGAIDKSVSISVYSKTYDADDEQYYESSLEDIETFLDFKFVEDKRTGKRYLAYVVVSGEGKDKSERRNIYTDYFDSSVYGDTHQQHIQAIRSVPGREIIWSNDNRGQSLCFSSHRYGTGSRYEFGDIGLYATSALDFS